MSAIELIDVDGDERDDVAIGGISVVVQSAALLVLDPRENFRERASSCCISAVVRKQEARKHQSRDVNRAHQR